MAGMTTTRCFDCDDHGHLTDEHCWYEGQICRCGETPLWDANPVNPCPSSRHDLMPPGGATSPHDTQRTEQQ